MSERKWITREEIAEILDQRAILLAGRGREIEGIGDEFLEMVHKVSDIQGQAQGYRDIDKMSDESLRDHVHQTRKANA